MQRPRLWWQQRRPRRPSCRLSFLGGGTVGVGGHGDDEGDADAEEVDDRKRAFA